MKSLIKFIFIGLLFLPFMASAANTHYATQHMNLDAVASRLEAAAPNLSHHIIKLALETYYKAREKGYDQKGILSVIDFSLPTYEKSLWIFNVKQEKLLFNTYVAHGKNSGNTIATRFSNQHRSDESSLGMYLTGQTYYGRDGLSMRLIGLSGKYNDNALSRAVVMHGAWYVRRSFINEYHRAGRSWGCPAVSPRLIGPITNVIKDGTLIYAYANDPAWLSASTYVV